MHWFVRKSQTLGMSHWNTSARMEVSAHRSVAPVSTQVRILWSGIGERILTKKTTDSFANAWLATNTTAAA